MGQNFSNYIQFIIFGLFIGFSVIAWAIRQLNEQRVKRQYLQQRERQRIETLRTGRTTEQTESPPPPQMLTTEQRLAEIARRRQAEMAKRRQAQQQAPVSVRTTPAPPPISRNPAPRAPMPRPPGSRVPTARPPLPTAPRPQPRPMPVPAPTAGGKLNAAQRRAMVLEARRRELEARKPPAPTPLHDTEGLLIHVDHSGLTAFPGDKTDKLGPAVPQALHAGLTDPQSLRNAFILKEILDAPVSLRHDAEPG